MKAVVTGASGFLGRHVANELYRRGVEVIAVSRREMSCTDGIRQIRVEHYRDLPGADVIVHFAEENQISAAEAAGDGHGAESLSRVTTLLQSGRFGRFVYASSAAVYGDQRTESCRVNDVPQPLSSYARTKLACERIVLDGGGLILRLGNIVGPDMSRASVVINILDQIPGTAAVLVRDETPVRDYLWIDDMRDCTARLVEAEACGIFNIGSGKGVSVRDLAELALRAAGESERQIRATHAGGRPSHIVLDIAATTKAIGWYPSTSLDVAFGKILEIRNAQENRRSLYR